MELLWIGSKHGVEGDEARARGIPFRSVSTGKFRRYPDFKTVTDAVRVPLGVPQAWWILRGFRPDVIFSTGGYVSTPSVLGGTRMAPVLSHEQTAILGLATRLNARFVDVQALTFDSSVAHARETRKIVVTGNPVRGSLKDGTREGGLKRFGFRSELPVLFVTGGARGSTPLNERVEAILDDLLARMQILHQTGARTDNPDFERLSGRQRELPVRDEIGISWSSGCETKWPTSMRWPIFYWRAPARARLPRSRFLGKTAILIPLPGAGGNEQHRNAEALSSVDGAVVIDQTAASPAALRELILGLIADPERRSAIGSNAAKAGRPDAAARLADQLLALAESRRNR